MPLQRNNPHDKLFKETFSSMREVRAFITNFVSPKLWKSLDLDTLAIENGSYTNEYLKEFFADIIYSCKRNDGKELRITILFEHKSYPDDDLPLQLLQYLTAGYKRRKEEKPTEPLGIILPILLYHGSSKFNKKKLIDLTGLEDKELKEYIPTFNYEAVDLGKISDSVLISLNAGVLLPTTLRLFKHKDDREYILHNSAEFLTFVQYDLTEAETNRLIITVVSYIFMKHQLNQQEFNVFSKNLNNMVQAQVGGMFKVWLDEGEVKGKKIKENLLFIKISSSIFKDLPQFSDERVADLTSFSVSKTKELRQLLSEHNQKTAPAILLRKYFRDIELQAKEKRELNKAVKDFYRTEEKD